MPSTRNAEPIVRSLTARWVRKSDKGLVGGKERRMIRPRSTVGREWLNGVDGVRLDRGRCGESRQVAARG